MKPRRLATYKEETCPEGQCLTWGHCSVDVFISTHQVPGAGLFCWELERQPAHRLLRTRSTDWEGASWVRRGLLEGRPWRTIIYMLPTKWFSANISFALQKNPEYYLPYHRSGNWGSKKVIVLSLAASRGRGEVPDSPKLHWVLEEAELASRLWLWSLGSSLGQLSHQLLAILFSEVPLGWTYLITSQCVHSVNTFSVSVLGLAPWQAEVALPSWSSL